MNPLQLVRALLAGTSDEIAVTGATGWFGATALDLLYEALGPEAVHRVRGYASRAREVTVSDGRRVVVRALPDLVGSRFSVLMHFAYLTRDRVADLGVSDYVAANAQISSTVLAAVQTASPRWVVTTSSGAVYRSDGSMEADLGANPYGALKRLDELAFSGLAHEVGAVSIVPRVFSVAGPRMTKPSAYALGSMIAMAKAGGPVVVRAGRPVVRSYCGVDEVLALTLQAAHEGRSRTFDTGGHIVEMAELAALVADEIGGGCAVERPELDETATTDRYVGQGAAMAGLAARARMELRSLPALVRATARGMQQ